MTSIVIPLLYPKLLLVSVDQSMYLLDSSTFITVSKARTSSISNCKIRMILHHPEESKVLTAITNMSCISSFGSMYTTYRLQLYPFYSDCLPDLEDVSYGLLSLSARIYNPQSSCTITSHAVICLNMIKGGSLHLSIYSIRHGSFGQCLWTLPLTTVGNVTSLDLSPRGNYLVLGIRRSGHSSSEQDLTPPFLSLFEVKGLAFEQKKIYTKCLGVLSVQSDCNVVAWALKASSGICVGTSQGDVIHWCSHNQGPTVTEMLFCAEWYSH